MLSESNDKLYKLASSFLKGIGPVSLRKLLANVGRVEVLFTEPLANLNDIEGVSKSVYTALQARDEALKKAEKELKQIEQQQIQVSWFEDKDFPYRLNQCADAPCLIYHKGNANFNAKKVLSIVGARNASRESLAHTEQLIESLKHQQDLLIVSGLAYGADITAHVASMKHNIPTLGVLAHGLQHMYPVAHQKWANEMQKNGGVCTEFNYETEAIGPYFPKRNRIVAGLSDATLVIDSKVNGGSMITANIAFSYAREVMAFPTAVHSGLSGTNQLIKTHRASLVENAQDVMSLLGWEKNEQNANEHKKEEGIIQQQLSEPEQKLYLLIKESEKLHIDVIANKTGLSQQDFSMDLLNLEFKGVVQSLPGDYFETVK